MEKAPSEIKSFAFFDLETTGLPEHEYNRTKITEISFVVVSKEHLLCHKTKDVPRVLHKLTLCFNPFKRISYESEKITHLTNELLEHERRFDENAGKVILGFLNQMQQPCILVAHNGDKFDFPLLKKAFDDIKMEIPEDLLTADSLNVFKDIELVEEMNQTSGVSVKPLEENPELEVIAQEYEEKEKSEETKKTEPLEVVQSDETDKIASTSEIEIVTKEDMQKMNETTPKLQKNVSRIPDDLKLQRNARKRENPERQSTVRKNLFRNYKLASIYERFIGDEPEVSHFAEADVIAMLKCAAARKELFVELITKHAKPLKAAKTFRIAGK